MTRHFEELATIATAIDTRMRELSASGVPESEVLWRMRPHVPEMHRLWVEASDEELRMLARARPGFYIYAKLMEKVSEPQGQLSPSACDRPTSPEHVRTGISEHWSNTADSRTARTRSPLLTLNGQFLQDFIASDAPCFAVGLVEEQTQPRAFLGLRLTEPLSRDLAAGGFEFRHVLHAFSECELIEWSFYFRDARTYSVMVNPGNRLVKAVIPLMTARGYFFLFTLIGSERATAFRCDMSEAALLALKESMKSIQSSSTTEEDYRKVLLRVRKDPHVSEAWLNWVCRDRDNYLDLTHNRVEMRPLSG